jgi:succinyl-CoA synthetase beta subunit
MKLHEYQSKLIFAKYGIPIPKGRVAATASEARAIAEELGCRVVIKSQVLVGGRGKAGGIKLAKNPREAEELATQILGMEIKGLPVRKVLVDEAANISKEIYLGITNDRAVRKPVMMCSAAGGVEITRRGISRLQLTCHATIGKHLGRLRMAYGWLTVIAMLPWLRSTRL